MDDLTPTVIKIIGLGGGGCNAVDRMIELGLEAVDFVAANTDAQALAGSLAPTRLRLGPRLTRGLGAGGRPEIGAAAADESRDDLRAALQGADLVFLTAGLGGGTGSGAIPIAAEVARSAGALSVAIITTPFSFEATRRRQNAEAGLARLKMFTDTMIPVSNDKLLAMLPRHTPLDLALRVADEVLRQGVQGIAELINKPGLINMDFANVRSLMKVAGGSMMAIGHGRGEGKALEAVRQALNMPLLDIHSMAGACGVLVHFTGGDDLSLHEVSQAAEEVTRAAPQADVIFGATVDALMTGRAQVILVATGIPGQRLDGAITGDIIFRRPAKSKEAQTEEHSGRHFMPPPANGQPDGDAHLADALFSQAASAVHPLEQPWVVADSPLIEPRAAETGSPAAHNNLDVPAFMRRRRSLRDIEGGK